MADVGAERHRTRSEQVWHDERELMDYVTCGTGSYFNFGEIMPTFQFADKLGVEAAAAIKPTPGD